jgi:hypothetical protein
MTKIQLANSRLRNGLGTRALNAPTTQSVMITLKCLSFRFSATQWGLMYAINGNTRQHIICTARAHRSTQNRDGSWYYYHNNWVKTCTEHTQLSGLIFNLRIKVTRQRQYLKDFPLCSDRENNLEISYFITRYRKVSQNGKGNFRWRNIE